jgi:hypothetical protein
VQREPNIPALILLAAAAFVPPVDVDAAVFPQPLTVGTAWIYSQPVIAFETNSDGGKVEFAAQTRARPGFDVTYGRFNVALSASAAGESKGDWMTPGLPAGGLNDFRIRYHGSAWGFEGHHLFVRGFDRQSEAPGHTAPEYRPDMTLQSSGGTLYGSFDPDTRVFHLSEGLNETGGNFDVFWTLGASHSHVRDESALLSDLYAPDSRFLMVRDIEIASLAAGGGIAVSSNMAGMYFDQALFGGYGPQYRAWGDRTDVAWNLVRVNLRVRMGVRNRWFDAGVGFENEAHAALAGSERMVMHGMSAQAKVEVFL